MRLFKISVAVTMVLCCLSGCCCPLIQMPDVVEVKRNAVEATESTEALIMPTEETIAVEQIAEATTEAATEATTVPTYPEGVTPITELLAAGDGYQIFREDHSYRNENGQVLFHHYYDYVVLTGASAANKSINELLAGLKDDFFWSEEDLQAEANRGYGPSASAPYLYTQTSSVTHISSNCISIDISYEWYCGGVFNNGTNGYVFDLRTGALATLDSLTDIEPAELEAQLKEITWNEIKDDGPWEDAYQTLSDYTLDKFDFSIQEGQIVLHFPEYLFFPGAAGPVTVFTGIYVLLN